MDPSSDHTTGGARIRIRIISPTPNDVTGPDVTVQVTAVLFTVE
jgi:hypothetical protein